MDGGDWVLFLSLVTCGLVIYLAVDRFGAGRVWVPALQGPLKLLGITGFSIGAAGVVGLVTWGFTSMPDKRATQTALAEDPATPWWAVLSIVAFGLGAVLTAIAITLGRRQVPSGHPEAQRHRAERARR